MFEYNTLEQAFSLNWIYFKPQSSLKYTQLSENACSRVYTSILTWLGIFERVKKYFIHIFTWLRYFSKKAQLSEKAWAYLLCNILGIKLQNFSLNWITYPRTTLIRPQNTNAKFSNEFQLILKVILTVALIYKNRNTKVST